MLSSFLCLIVRHDPQLFELVSHVLKLETFPSFSGHYKDPTVFLDLYEFSPISHCEHFQIEAADKRGCLRRQNCDDSHEKLASKQTCHNLDEKNLLIIKNFLQREIRKVLKFVRKCYLHSELKLFRIKIVNPVIFQFLEHQGTTSELHTNDILVFHCYSAYGI